jgi:hypothetical protein
MPRSLAQEQDILKRPTSKRPPRLTSREAHAQGRPFQELLQYYAIERFLYRLAQSSHCDKFILKGALLLTVWQAPFSRSTVDIDLLGKTSNKLEHIASLVSEICGLDVEADGVKFDPASIKTARIKEDADYEEIRVRFRATLASLPGPLFDECREVLEPS